MNGVGTTQNLRVTINSSRRMQVLIFRPGRQATETSICARKPVFSNCCFTSETKQNMAEIVETAETFEQRVKDTVINGFLTSGLAIGHQLKLFDALAEFDDFETVGNIASKSNCKPRYCIVRKSTTFTSSSSDDNS